MKLSGWGMFPAHDAKVARPATPKDIVEILKSGGTIARGNGRAYGDSAIGARQTVQTAKLNHIISFDRQTGLLVAEAGVLLRDIITAFLPHGWFPPVTPGTKFVTLGGMIAADVHGKNHHKDGSFRNFVEWLDLICADGTVTRCSRDENPALFEWTIGGMGLTGIILRAGIRMRAVPSAWIRQVSCALPNLDAVLAAFEGADDATYSVAWIDCVSRGKSMGRSILMLGEHATQAELSDDAARYPFEIPAKTKRTVPFTPPVSVLNGLSVRAFNSLYYWNGRRKAGTSFIDYDTYFYPLDAILGWNKIYGRRGFMQFQCVLPLETARDGLHALLRTTSFAGAGSFLAVLKRFGPQDTAFSFPMLGYTLALDFPATPRMIALMRKLDQITLEHGGRFYLAKDSRMSAEVLDASDARTAAFRDLRDGLGAAERFQSKQSERLFL